MAQQGQQREESEMMEVTRRTGTDPLVMAAAASVLLSWYEFFVRGNREMGLFVGLWPPTFLAFASYYRQAKILAKVDTLVPGSLRETVNRMVGGQ